MFINFKFSLFKAYVISLKTNYKHVLFYLSWYLILWLIGLAVLLGLGIYTDILNFSAMIQNYNWMIASLKNQLVTFFIGYRYQDSKITEISFYGFLKLIFSEDILNVTLSSMSLKEYFNVVFLPKKIGLIPVLMLYISFVMAASIGYIKTALKFQDNKKATLHDIYQYIYLLPQYFLGKIIILLFFLILIFLISILGLLVLSVPFFTGDTKKIIVFIGIYGVIAAVFLMYLCQRLRFVKYFIIDEEVSVFQACKLSWNLTQGNVVALSLFSLITFIVGWLHPMSGLFIILSAWLNQQAKVSVYKQMLENKNNNFKD